MRCECLQYILVMVKPKMEKDKETVVAITHTGPTVMSWEHTLKSNFQCSRACAQWSNLDK